jgi:hypothetical protein
VIHRYIRHGGSKDGGQSGGKGIDHQDFWDSDSWEHSESWESDMWDSDDTGKKKSVHKEGHNHVFDNSDSSEWGYSDESPENNRQSNINNHNNGALTPIL